MLRLALIFTLALLILEALAPHPTANDLCPTTGRPDASVEMHEACR